MSHNKPGRREFLATGAGVSLLGLDAFDAESCSALGQLQGEAQAALAKFVPNPRIQQDRLAALDILKPSEKEIQRGLALHRESLVFDTYGFSPRASLDPVALNRLIDASASDAEYDDAREEQSMIGPLRNDLERIEFLHAWQQAGVTCIFQNAGEEGQDPLRLVKRLARFTFLTDNLPGQLTKAVHPDDIVAAKKAGHHCLYLTGNGVPLTQNWDTVADELRYVRIFYQLGIRMMHLTYQRRNMIGDGCAEAANGGLSDFGKSVVGEMNRVGVIPDVAHSGWQTSLETARLSDKPVLASHTTCAELHPHIRSKPDEVIRAIADTGGLVGICCISRFLRGQGDIAALLDHIDHVVKKFGSEHVGIGSDVAYTSQYSSATAGKIKSRPRSRKEWRSLWPDDNFRPTAAAGQSIAWTNWPMFTVGLVQRGYKDEQIRQIIGGNMLRVCRAAIEDIDVPPLSRHKADP
jgi:membrane dipeptidase